MLQNVKLFIRNSSVCDLVSFQLFQLPIHIIANFFRFGPAEPDGGVDGRLRPVPRPTEPGLGAESCPPDQHGEHGLPGSLRAQLARWVRIFLFVRLPRKENRADASHFVTQARAQICVQLKQLI